MFEIIDFEVNGKIFNGTNACGANTGETSSNTNFPQLFLIREFWRI